MRKFMMKYLMVNGKQATFLRAEKEEGRLSLLEKLKLRVHTAMCAFCREFEKQMSGISRESRHIASEDLLGSSSGKGWSD